MDYKAKQPIIKCHSLLLLWRHSLDELSRIAAHYGIRSNILGN